MNIATGRSVCRPPAARRVVPMFAALLALAVQVAAAQTVERYTVRVQGQVAGALVKATDAQGRISVDFSYRDNGRGPDLKETYTLDAHAAPQAYRGSGTSTFGGEIRDRYDWADGQGEWASLVDRGRQPFDAGALYVPVEGSLVYQAQLAASLLSRPGASVAAVPAGRLSIEKLDEASTAAGPVALYAMLGADLNPFYLWLRERPDHALFAFVEPGWEVLADGAEGSGAELLERQQRAETRRLESLQQRLARPLDGVTVFRAVRWFDAPRAAMRGPADVVVFDGRISAIVPPGTVPDGLADQTIDGRGRTLLPGLYDMHSHIGRADALLYLAGGVTTVRDLANQNDDLLALRDQIDRGVLAGPRIVANGFIEGKSPFSARNGFVVDSLAEARAAVDWYQLHGFRQLKLYNSFKPEWVKPLAAYAHEKGLRVGGHVPAFMRAEEAVRAGYDELHHINQLMLNFFVRREDDTRTLLRFTLVGDKVAGMDIDGPRVNAFLKLLHARGTVVDPTLSAFESMYTQRNGAPNPTFAAIADHMPPVVQRWLRSAEMAIDDGNARRYGNSFDKMVAMIGRLHRAGVPLVAGTDNWAGFSLPRELELYVKAGIPPGEVLRIATWNGARYTQTLAEAGSIEVGKRADLLLVDGDPSVDIGAVRRAALVMKGGVAYLPAELHAALGVRPFTPAAVIDGRAAAAPR